jgi:hypothetical protein
METQTAQQRRTGNRNLLLTLGGITLNLVGLATMMAAPLSAIDRYSHKLTEYQQARHGGTLRFKGSIEAAARSYAGDIGLIYSACGFFSTMIGSWMILYPLTKSEDERRDNQNERKT